MSGELVVRVNERDNLFPEGVHCIEISVHDKLKLIPKNLWVCHAILALHGCGGRKNPSEKKMKVPTFWFRETSASDA